MKRLGKISLALLILYWLPFMVILLEYRPYKSIKALPHSDAVIVFGTLVRDGKVSPLLQERLDASIAIYRAHKTKEVVLSNTPKAANVMQRYLIANGVPMIDIALDTTAKITPDSCRYEKKLFPKGRKLIFISQGYHLPRINYQCNKLGVNGVLFPAEQLSNKASLFSSFEVFRIRTKRYIREAGLSLLAMVGVYK